MKKILFAFVLSFACFLAGARNFALSTNVLGYADLGTLNLEASYGVARHWSVNAGLRYNPFSYGSGENSVCRKQRSVSAGARYWPWHVYSGWWVSSEMRYQEYSHGGLRSPETSEGDRLGIGLGGGYSYMLTPHLNLDFGVSLWSGYDAYRTFDCRSCGRVVGSGERAFFLPGDIIFALTYIF